MPSNKDYSQVPLEELIQQEQKMQSRKTTTAVFVGVLQTGRDVWPTTVDPDQFQQAIINMVLNARDAMPHGGTLTITTGDVEVAGGAPNADSRPGEETLVPANSRTTGV